MARHQDDSKEAHLARLHQCALQLDTAKHSQATADAAIEAALQALHATHEDEDIRVQQSALHVLTLAARDPTNAHELGSLQVGLLSRQPMHTTTTCHAPRL